MLKVLASVTQNGLTKSHQNRKFFVFFFYRQETTNKMPKYKKKKTLKKNVCPHEYVIS